ncbi:helix-turn-helix domain-containing protein [Pseudoalteromonas lipolytica]|uniref:Helix-turn-helix domain-containing protein n=1 Tax=Pseudoalteromonas lipolytica TaxID=570156 RepID=A0AAD0S0G4_9GAMM|nr:helix-turn-helix domain-containing protein [Pseudoalteromonas donghaensis]AXV65910.1 helix-turn-helix domain-containing protein [Pseudoalteromonas donghaensis]
MKFQHSGTSQAPNKNKPLIFDYGSLTIYGKKNKVSPATFRVFEFLYRNIGKTVSRLELLWIGWPEQKAVLGNVNVSIYQLRIILNDTNYIIESVRGVGFKLINMGGNKIENNK